MRKKKNIHFEISERKILLRFMDVVSVFVVLHLVGFYFDFDYFIVNKEHLVWSFFLAFYLLLFGTIFELYNLQKASKFEIASQNILLTSSVTVLFYLLTPFYTPMLPENRMQIVYFFLSINLALFIWRYLYITLFSAPRFFKRLLLLCSSSEFDKIATTLHKYAPNYKVIGFINTDLSQKQTINKLRTNEFNAGNLKDIITTEKVSEIVIVSAQEKGMPTKLSLQLIELLKTGMTIRDYVHVYEETTQRIPVHHVEKDFYTYLPFSRNNSNKFYLFFHRVLDILLSLIGLVIGLLLVPIIIMANLIANRGPLFYSQIRIGKNGKPFKIYKLRTMVKNAEKNGAQYATKQDSRVTKFGRFLRKSRIDEFPQFLNILIGDMSIIGPRPERPIFVKKLSKEMPFYEIRHTIKPGLTGWAQVKTRYGTNKDDALEKLQYDLYYIKHRNFLLDFNIIIKTLSTIIFFRGQ